ncbi:hypothetical protein BS636_03935 [Acinetobacter sp. LoGeW2-3]|uniref:hypothetical protein n=1 Tax=Acinetobacter sp. LoGeW2-3 TaxID=1808001 RepID=UPI000C059A21|nr:hypothetical protein [Acinetobacter sp. LoGeW2-3]ATO18875.1 hypothetical protein BS636_03935 [Acinetobacter sp. LoGeW2-3]
MQKFLVVLQYACLAFGLYLIYSVGMSLYTQQFELMELVADIGTILICLDLGVFLYSNRGKHGISMEEYARQLENAPSKLVYVTRKLGHLGILLIITSWIVPIING